MVEAAERRDWWKYALVTVPAIVILGSLSGYLSNSGNGNGWFEKLELPAFMPPGWTFGLVWNLLYVLLGIALALILAEPPSFRRRSGLIYFFIQLALNIAWSPIFFGAHDIWLGFAIILLMASLASSAALQFWRIRALAGALMLPYLAWLCFAAVLNAAIGRMNPGAGTSLLG